MRNYTAKDTKFTASVADSLRQARVAVVTAMVMKAYCDGLEGVQLRAKMVEAQKLLKSHSILPAELKKPIKAAYLEGLTLK